MITVNSIEQRALIGSFALTDNINARSTCTFNIITDEPITVGQEVLVYDGLVKVFGGTIETFNLSYLRGQGGIRKLYALNCLDFNAILDRRLIGETYVDKTVGFIVNDIVNNFLVGEGITVSTITNSTEVIKQAVFNYVTVSDAFNFIRNTTGLNYNINFDKQLSFFLNEDNQGNQITDDNCFTMSLQETRQEYRNTQYVRAGDSTTEVQVKEVPSPKPDGESKTFTLRFPVATVPTIYINDVAINSADVGINGLDRDKKWYWQKNSRTITQDDTEVTLTTQTLSVSYQGLKPIIVRAENPLGQSERSNIEGGTGIYEQIYTELSIDNKNAARDLANGLLKKYGEIPRTITISTFEKRNAGEIIRVTSNNLGISEDYLITSVSAMLDDVGNYVYTLSGASGEDLGGWVEFFRSMMPKGDLTIRENEVLVKINSVIEQQGLRGAYRILRLIGLVPSDTLVPSETLTPGTPLSEVIVND
jgi:hypothetical protein